MKIRTQLLISMVFFGVTLCFISALVLTTERRVESLSKQEELAKNIELKVGEITYLSNDFLLYHEIPQFQRWDSQYASILGDVSNLNVDKPDQRALIKNLKDNLRRLKEVFRDIAVKIEKASQTRVNLGESGFIQVSWSRMGVQTQGIHFDASRLALKLNEEAIQLKNLNSRLVFALMGAFTAFLLTNYLLIYRRMLTSISALQVGTRVIGSGNLDYSILVPKVDEIGELAQAFNQMTMNLKAITASKVDLEKEIVERKRTEQALQLKHEELTAANEELQAQQEEVIATNEELQAQQEELTAANEELQAQQEELSTTYQELQLQAAEMDATISSIAGGIVIYGLSGNVVRMNEVAREMLGYNGSELKKLVLKPHLKQRINQADDAPFGIIEGLLERALKGEISRDEEVMISKDSDQPIWLSATLAPIRDNKGNSTGVVFTFTDITERKRKVDEILASERELLQVTLNSLGEGVVATDQQERIIFINEAAAKLTGYSQVEAIGASLSEVLLITDDKTDEPYAKIVFHQKFNNLILVTRDLRKIPVSIDSSPIKTGDGAIVGTVTVLQDISEKQKIELELKKAEKLDSLGILAGGIAHDFNNILAAILANIQLAMIKLKKDENIEAYLANTVGTTRKASELTKQLLTFSKGGAPVKKDASLNELIRDTAEFVLRGSKTKAVFLIPEDLWTASIDVGQISQVIHNLALNADQAMPRGGTIQFRAENLTVKKNRRMTPGKYVKISVHDQGVGIPKANLAKIFDPYFTTKKDGNGLGLATSYSIITQHNGYIDVESEEGSGTTFFIYLPASPMAFLPTESHQETAAAKEVFKILLMDDEEQILNAVGEMLKDYGHQVVTTTDGATAINLYKQAMAEGAPFDAVIMDLTVPGGMGGQEAIVYLREHNPRIKAIVSSGYANDPIMADYERFGFSGVVSKPYKIDELNGVLYRVVGQK